MSTIWDNPNALCPSRRSLITIIRTCFSTIFICAWVSVHPNIPPTKEGQARALWRRLKMMFWAIVAPELILAWAVRQWLAARKIRDTFNQARKSDQTWTTEHGHFLAMGGYILIDSPTTNNSPMSRVLSYELFEVLVHDPKINFPPLSISEINDKSKGDFLTKTIAVLQTTWFIVECIVRATQGLAVTELELATLALASLNGITYFFWWHKPLGVLEPARIYLDESLRSKTMITGLDDTKEIIPQQDLSDILFAQILASINGILTRMRVAVFERSESRSTLDSPFRRILFFPICFFFFLTFPIVACFPFGLTLILWIFKPGPPPKPVTRSFPIFFYFLDIFWHDAPYVIKRGVHEATIMCLDTIQHSSGTLVVPLLVWFITIPVLFFFSAIILLVYFPIALTIIGVIYIIFSSIFELISTSTVNPSDTYVPAFYAPNTEGDHYSRVIVFAFFGITFGGIHCIGWNFIYPTRLEQTLWRVTSVIVTTIPIIAAPVAFLLSKAQQGPSPSHMVHKPEHEDRSEEDFVFINQSNASGFISIRSQIKLQRLEFVMYFGDFITTCLLFVYVLARVSLLGQALALLRAQPPDAFLEINWTRYIPHI